MLRLEGVEIALGDWRLAADLAVAAGSATAVMGPTHVDLAGSILAALT